MYVKTRANDMTLLTRYCTQVSLMHELIMNLQAFQLQPQKREFHLIFVPRRYTTEKMKPCTYADSSFFIYVPSTVGLDDTTSLFCSFIVFSDGCLLHRCISAQLIVH